MNFMALKKVHFIEKQSVLFTGAAMAYGQKEDQEQENFKNKNCGW